MKYLLINMAMITGIHPFCNMSLVNELLPALWIQTGVISTKTTINVGAIQGLVAMAPCSSEAIQESRAKVVRSPSEAAIGVATLSGLMLNRRENRMTPTMTRPRTKLATEAVTRALAQSSRAWWISNSASGIHPRTTAAIEASIPTPIAWHWMSARLPTIRDHCWLLVSMWPRFAWVDKRDAKVISRLPFNPNSAGTRMYTSEISWYTGQCWNKKNTICIIIFMCFVFFIKFNELAIFFVSINLANSKPEQHPIAGWQQPYQILRAKRGWTSVWRLTRHFHRASRPV